MATEIEATYRVVTPMFCGGSDPGSARAELRVPSFKGVLRFWWRALAWARQDGDLEMIRREEDKLFGSAGGGKSRVSMSLTGPIETRPLAAGEVLEDAGHVVGEGARYLGYGVMEAFPRRNRRAGELIRACLLAPFDLTVRMRARCLTDGQVRSLRDALIAVGLFGGMGAKSRKGYGSLVVRSLRVAGEESWRAPRSIDELSGRIGALACERSTNGWADFTALSGKTRHLFVTGAAGTPLMLLDLIGRELVRYRSWGHRGTVLGQPSERNFEDDHDLMKLDRMQRTKHPRRIAFGLPHNYGPRPSDQVGPFDRGLDRRASPLFIHLHECAGKPVAVLSFLPARFLPRGKSDISVGGRKIGQQPEEDLYRPVHDFLERLKRCEALHAKEVTP